MDLDPEAVKAEIEAVEAATHEVSARLAGRVKYSGARPGGILSRLSKVGSAEQGNDVNSQRSTREVRTDSRYSSRRFVDKDWNIARKRTAQGLFADDRIEEENEGHQQANGFTARKRMAGPREQDHDGRDRQFHPDGASNDERRGGLRSGHTNRDSNSARTDDWHAQPRQRPLGPRDNHEPTARAPDQWGEPERKVSGQWGEPESSRGPDGGARGPSATTRHAHGDQWGDPERTMRASRDEGEPRHREAMYDPFENSRQATRGGDQWNHHHHHPEAAGEHPQARRHNAITSRLTWGNRDDRNGAWGARSEGAAVSGRGPRTGRPGEEPVHKRIPTGQPQSDQQPEEGELPEGGVMNRVEFIAEKRPEAKHTKITEKDKGRNRRMLGAIMGHLSGAERQERSFEKSAVPQRRKELQEQSEKRAREEALKARQAARQRAHEARRKDVAAKRELLLQHNMKQAKLLCAQKIQHARELLAFIRTQTVPPILWKPASENRDVDNIYKQQAQEFELWADKQAAKLQAEQKGMRERAEKQWAEIDQMHEDRMQRRMHDEPQRGREQPRAEAGDRPPEVPHRAVKSSVTVTNRRRQVPDDAGQWTQKDVTMRSNHAASEPAEGDLGAEQEEPVAQADERDEQQMEEDDAEAHDEAYLLDEKALDEQLQRDAAADEDMAVQHDDADGERFAEEEQAPDGQDHSREGAMHDDNHEHGNPEDLIDGSRERESGKAADDRGVGGDDAGDSDSSLSME